MAFQLFLEDVFLEKLHGVRKCGACLVGSLGSNRLFVKHQGRCTPPSSCLPPSLLPLADEAVELLQVARGSLVLQGVSSVLAMDMSRVGKCYEDCALGEERERHLTAAECVLLHARAGDSCAGCAAVPRGSSVAQGRSWPSSYHSPSCSSSPSSSSIVSLTSNFSSFVPIFPSHPCPFFSFQQ